MCQIPWYLFNSRLWKLCSLPSILQNWSFVLIYFFSCSFFFLATLVFVVADGLSSPAMWDLSFPTRDGTHIPRLRRQIRNHHTVREVLYWPVFKFTDSSVICLHSSVKSILWLLQLCFWIFKASNFYSPVVFQSSPTIHLLGIYFPLHFCTHVIKHFHVYLCSLQHLVHLSWLLFAVSLSRILLPLHTSVGCSVTQLCLTLWHGIFQARILEWVAIHSSKGSSQPRDQTCVSCFCIGRQILYHCPNYY